MGVVANRHLALSVLLPTAAYVSLTCFTALRHEPWADEAQAWLLARDSSIADIWIRLLHYEGTPGLWHTILWSLARLRFPYTGLGLVSAALGTVAAYLVFRYAPFPFPIRLLLPFTYFLAYQYAVIARSYSLIAPLLFALAALFPRRLTWPWLYAALLSALALTSVHGLVLSALIALMTVRSFAAVLYLSIAALSVWSAWPYPDVVFVRHYNLSFAHFAQVIGRVLANAFTGDWISAVVLIAASAAFLRRGGTLPLFLTAALSLAVLSAVVYGQVWHFGIVFLAWLFALWVAALRARPNRWATGALAAALATHCFWMVRSVREELRTPYSGAKAAAQYLLSQRLPEAGLYGIGYASVAVQPYFRRNVFTNFDHSYWDWSSRNQMIRNYDRLAEVRPPWVLVGYKTDAENYLWNSTVRRSGYRRQKHFEGNLIWQGELFEPESFDLYERQ